MTLHRRKFADAPGPHLIAGAFVLAAALGFGACQSIEHRAGQALISQFGNACVTKGQWTDAAVQQNRALQDTLEELKKNGDKCKQFETQLATIQGLSASMQRYLSHPGFNTYLQHQSRLADLTPAARQLMAPGLSDDAKAAVLQSVFSEEMKLGSLKADFDTHSGDLNANVFKESTAKYIENMQTMMTDLPALQQCLQQSPRASIQLATQLMTVAGNSGSPATGATIGMIGQLINFGLSFMSDSSVIDRATYENQKSLMPQGLTCAMESMTELYCQAEDVREQLEFQAESYRQEIGPDGQMVDPIWRGMDILTRRLPVVADMLRRVRNGSDPSDEHDSARQNEVWGKVLVLDNVFREINGRLNIQERLYNSAGSEPNAAQIRETNLMTTLRDVSDYLESKGGPFRVLTDDGRRFACMFAADPEGKRCPELKPNDTVDNYIRTHFMGTNFTTLRQNWKIMYRRARESVDLQLAQQITIDPKIVIVGTMERSVDNVSPYEALKMVNAFLTELQNLRESDRDSDWNPRLKETIQDTQDRITSVLDAIQLKQKPGAPAVAPEDVDRVVISLMYEKFQLRIGVQFLTERIKKFVEWDLNRRLRRGEIPGNVAGILAQLGGEMTERLGGRPTHLHELRTDLDRAQSLIQMNLQNFLDYFRGNLRTDPMADAAEMLLEAANQANEPKTGPRRPNRQLLGELCILSAITYAGTNAQDLHVDSPALGASSPAESIRACKGARLESVYAARQEPAAAPAASSNPLYRFLTEPRGGTLPPASPLVLTYDSVFKFFSGAGTDKDTVAQRLGLAKAPTSEAPKPGEIHKELFRHTVAGPADADHTAFNRKVCTFHRFLRAGRIIEALPALNPDFRKALLKTP